MANEHDKPNDSQRPRKKAPLARRNRVWTDREKAWLRFGGTLAVAGIFGIFAPLVGLKFKGAKEEQQVAVSIGLVVLGGLISLVTFLRHGSLAILSPQTKRRIIYWVGGAFLSLVVLCGGLTCWNNSRHRLPVPPVPTHQPFVPGTTSGPMVPVRIVLKNVKNLDLTSMRGRLTAITSRPEGVMGVPPFTMQDEQVIVIATSDSIDDLAGKINFGKVETADSKSRIIYVIVDRSKFSEWKPK